MVSLPSTMLIAPPTRAMLPLNVESPTPIAPVPELMTALIAPPAALPVVQLLNVELPICTTVN